jgi:hypothetical protein
MNTRDEVRARILAKLDRIPDSDAVTIDKADIRALLDEPVPADEREWEYACDNGEYRRFTDEDGARHWADRGYTVRRRRKPSPAGPWEPVL